MIKISTNSTLIILATISLLNQSLKCPPGDFKVQTNIPTPAQQKIGLSIEEQLREYITLGSGEIKNSQSLERDVFQLLKEWQALKKPINLTKIKIPSIPNAFVFPPGKAHTLGKKTEYLQELLHRWSCHQGLSMHLLETARNALRKALLIKDHYFLASEESLDVNWDVFLTERLSDIESLKNLSEKVTKEKRAIPWLFQQTQLIIEKIKKHKSTRPALASKKQPIKKSYSFRDPETDVFIQFPDQPIAVR